MATKKRVKKAAPKTAKKAAPKPEPQAEPEDAVDPISHFFGKRNGRMDLPHGAPELFRKVP